MGGRFAYRLVTNVSPKLMASETHQIDRRRYQPSDVNEDVQRFDYCNAIPSNTFDVPSFERMRRGVDFRYDSCERLLCIFRTRFTTRHANLRQAVRHFISNSCYSSRPRSPDHRPAPGRDVRGMYSFRLIGARTCLDSVSLLFISA
jgi:hypothetical protein